MKIRITKKQYKNLQALNSEIDEQEINTNPENGNKNVESSTKAGSQKWISGIERGPANQIDVTKWSDIVGSTISRGKANPLW